MIITWLIGCGSWWYTSILGFGIGLIWAYKKDDIDNFIKNKYILISSLTIIIFIIIYSLPYLFKIFDGIVFVGCNVVLALVFVILLNLIIMRINFYNNLLEFIGNISFEIYLTHPLILRLIKGDGILRIIQFFGIIVLSKIYNFCFKKIYKNNKSI